VGDSDRALAKASQLIANTPILHKQQNSYYWSIWKIDS
jgi:hypothetical protein